MSSHLIAQSTVVKAQLRQDLPNFTVGSVVSVYYKIIEGTKERIQLYNGIVINRHGGDSLDATFTVLKNSTAGIKVERTFPLHSPNIDRMTVDSKPLRVRKANLRYLHKVKDPIKSVRTKKVIAKVAN